MTEVRVTGMIVEHTRDDDSVVKYRLRVLEDESGRTVCIDEGGCSISVYPESWDLVKTYVDSLIEVYGEE